MMRKIRKMAQKDLKETEEEMERRWEKKSGLQNVKHKCDFLVSRHEILLLLILKKKHNK